MNKFLLFLPTFLFSYFISFPYELKLKKDETAYFEINRNYPLELRWTLYINGVLTILYRYDNFPRQITLFDSLNSFKIYIDDTKRDYLYFVFREFKKGEVIFDIYLFNSGLVDFKGKKWNFSKF